MSTRFANEVEYTIKQNRRPSTSFLGNSDLESDNIQSLSIPCQKHPSKSTYGQANAEQLRRQGEAGTPQGPLKMNMGLVSYYPNQTQQTEPGSQLNMDCLPGKGCLCVRERERGREKHFRKRRVADEIKQELLHKLEVSIKKM